MNTAVQRSAVLLVALSVLLVLTVYPSQAQAAEVEVCSKNDPSELVQEALVRVRAELSAAGFSVEPEACSDQPVELGRISFLREGSKLEIRATSVSSQGTMIQLANLNQSTMTAEVIAVRAVESLRAVLLQSLRSGEFEEASISSSLREFTHYGLEDETSKNSETTELRAEEAKSVSSTGETKAEASSSDDEARRVTALFSMGPAVELQPTVFALTVGGEIRGILQYRGATLGVVGYFGVYGSPFEVGEGRAKSMTWSILFRPGVSIPCGPLWECHLGVLGGIDQANFTIDGTLEGQTRVRHQSFSLQGDAMFGRFFSSGLGVLLQVRGGALLKAPVLRSGVDDQQETWGRPLLASSLSLAFRL